MASAMRYLDRIEQAVESSQELEAIRDELAGDQGVPENERVSLDGRIGRYLADMERGLGWDEGNELDAVASRSLEEHLGAEQGADAGS